jgi:large subunit ribosomal protein L5
MSLQSITGVSASPLFAEEGDASKKIRAGMPIGATVELTGTKAYEFLDKVIQVVLPRLREWEGVEPVGDGNGNLTIRLPETVMGSFPDIEPHFDMFPTLFATDMVIHTSAKTDDSAVLLLSGFQMPFTTKKKLVVEEVKEEDPYAKFKKRDRGVDKKKK